MSTKILFGLSASAILLLSACGDEVTEVTEVNETTGMQVLEKGEALPKCNSDSEGSMVYALDSAAAYVCVDKKWNSLNGKDGADGKDGEKGDKGDQGEQGVKGDPGEQGEQGEKGDQGEKGEDGSSCTVEKLADSSGYKVICSGDSVGVILNGEKGEKGEQGETGAKGSSCNVFDKGEGTLTIVCNDGKNSRTVEFYKAVCGATPYDPEKMAPAYCDNGILYVKDSRDSQRYRVVPIGTQIWTAENMNYKTSSSHCPGNDEANCDAEGRLYNLDDTHEACPQGWHLPDTSEYRTLINTVGGETIAGKMLTSNSGWQTEDGKEGNGTDTYGFSAIPVGAHLAAVGGGGPLERNISAYFWTSSMEVNEDNEVTNQILQLSGDSDNATINEVKGKSQIHSYYYSVRCLKN